MKQYLFANRFNFFVFFAIFILTVFVKQGIIFSPAIILDDIQHFATAKYGDLANRNPYFFVYALINHVLEKASYIRLFYLMLFAACGSLFYVLLNKVLKDNIAAILITLLIFLNPSLIIIFIFINGSNNIFFLSFFLLSTYLIYLFVSKYWKQKSIYRLPFLLICCFFTTLTSIFTANGIFMPLVIFLLPWWRSSLFKTSKLKFVFFVLCILVAIGIGVSFSLFQIFNHGYNSMQGRLVYDLGSMLENAIILILNIFNQYIVPKTVTEHYALPQINLFLVASVAIVLLLSLLALFKTKHRVFKILPFTGLAIIFVTMPLSPMVIVHSWHYFLPSIFTLLFVCFLLYMFLHKVVFYVVTTAIILLSLSITSQQIKPFKASFQEQEKLLTFIKNESPYWERSAQVIILTNKILHMTGLTSIGGVRALSYLRSNANRPDIRFASIAPENTLKSRIDFSGFSPDYPIYIYTFDYSTSKVKTVEYLLLSNKTDLNIYSIFPQVKLIKTIPSLELTTGLPPLLNNNYFFLNVPKLSSEPNVIDSKTYIQFDGTSSLKKDIDISSLSTMSFEFKMKSESSTTLCWEEDQHGYSASCPPMPLLAIPLAVYQTKPTEYLFQIKHSTGNTYVTYQADLEQWHQFKFVFNLDAKSLMIFVDGNIYDMLTNIDVLETKEVKLGKGYKDRFWKGKIAYFKIYRPLSSESHRFYYLDIKPTKALD